MLPGTRHTAPVLLALLPLSLFDCTGKDRRFSAPSAEEAGQTSRGGEQSGAGGGGTVAGGAAGEASEAGQGGDVSEASEAGQGGDVSRGSIGGSPSAGTGPTAGNGGQRPQPE